MAPPFFHGPDTFAEAHVANSVRQAGAVASLAANNKATKYDQLTGTHVFNPVAIETAGTWHYQAIELVEEIGKRTTNITGYPKKTAYLFQQLSVSLQRETRFLFEVPSPPASPLQSVMFFST